MAREVFDFLTESLLWDETRVGSVYANCTEHELRDELSSYREHCLGTPVATATGLGLAVSARDGAPLTNQLVNRSVAYFDEVLLPDPVFRLTDRLHDRLAMPGVDDTVPRRDLAAACREMQSLTALVALGRVRFVPSSLALEPPAVVPLLYSDTGFVERVPQPLRRWFYDRARVRKVVVTEGQERLVLSRGVDAETCHIQVDFGQKGFVSGYDHMRIVSFDDDDRTVRTVLAPPQDQESLTGWVESSINRAAGDLLGDVLSQAAAAQRLNCYHLTTCPVTAELLGIHLAGGTEGAHATQANLALDLALPVLDAASPEQLAELVRREPGAFEQFALELKRGVASLAGCTTTEELAARLSDLQHELANRQVIEVDRCIRRTMGRMKWDFPLAVGRVSLGVLGAVQGLFPLAASLLHGGVELTSLAKDWNEHKLLPGYFLWKLEDNGGKRP